VALSASFPAFFLLSQPFLDHHGVPLALFGVLAVPVHLIRAGGGLVSGAAVRRFGIGTTLVVALAGVVAGLAIVAAVDHVAAFVGVGLTTGAAMLAMPAIGAYINERTESRVRATVLSVAPMGTSLMLGATSALAGIIADESIRLAYGAIALFIAVAGGAALLAFLSSHEEAERAVETMPVEAEA
jgi:MFS family permease